MVFFGRVVERGLLELACVFAVGIERFLTSVVAGGLKIEKRAKSSSKIGEAVKYHACVERVCREEVVF